MIVTAEPTAPTRTEQLAGVLQCIAGSGSVVLRSRTYDGIGEQDLIVTPPYSLPLPLITLILDRWSVRLAPITRAAGGQLLDLPTAFVVWHPPTEVVDRAPRVTAAAQRTIAAALRTMPPVSLLIDGAHEVVAGWRLERPLTDLHQAKALLVGLAERLGGETTPLEDLAAFDVPFAGIVRNWSGTNHEYIHLDEVNPTRRYALTALAQTPPAKPATTRRIPS